MLRICDNPNHWCARLLRELADKARLEAMKRLEAKGAR